MTTLREDFSAWWEVLPKYRKREIEARDRFGDEEVRERIADSNGKLWPGPEENVQYFVKLWNGAFVGFRETRTETGKRSRYAEFPIFVPEKS